MNLSTQSAALTEYGEDLPSLSESNEELRRVNAMLILGMQVAGLALAEVDYVTDLKHLSAEAARLFGLGVTAMVLPRARLHEMFHPDDLALLMPRIAASLDPAGDGQLCMDYRIVRPDGEVRWLRVREQVVFGGAPSDRKAVRASMALMDITAEKNHAAALLASEERMHLATEATAVGIWEWNIKTHEIHWDAQMFRIYGLMPTSDGQVPYSVWRAAVLDEDLPQQERVLQESISQLGRSSRTFHIHRADDGECRLIQSVETVRADAAGMAEWVVGTNLDITERRQTNDQLRLSEVRYRRLFEAAHDGVLLIDPETRKITDANPFMTTLLGYNRDELIGKELFEIGLIEDETASQAMFEKLRIDHQVRYENLPLESQTGRHQEVEVVANLYDENGHTVIQCNVRDITVRKRSEEALRLTNTAMESVASAIFITSPDGSIQYVNPAFTRLSGYAATEAIGRKPCLISSGEHDEAFYQKLWQTITSGRIWSGQITNRHRDGQPYVCEQSISPVKNTKGQITHFVSVQTDITERLRAEFMVRNSEALFSALIEQAPVGIYIVDAQFRLRQMNPKALPDFEVQPLIGRDFAEIIDELWPAKIGDNIISAFRHTLATGEAYQAPDVSAKRKDTHEEKVYEWSLQRVTLPDGEYGVVCYYNDITERKQEEQIQRRLAVLTASHKRLEREIARRQVVEDALIASQQTAHHLLGESQRLQDEQRRLSHRLLSVEEEERKRISRELHDVIAQALAGINMRLSYLKSSASTGEALHHEIEQTQLLVAQSVDAVHHFARDLRPSMLDFLGLVPALESYLKDFTERTCIPVSIVAGEGIERLGGSERTVLYRIAQEALTNVDRHAKASSVCITLAHRNGSVCMDIQDDGQGFQVEGASSVTKPNRLGMLGMRERVEMIGGTFRVDSAPGKTTTIRVEIPLPS